MVSALPPISTRKALLLASSTLYGPLYAGAKDGGGGGGDLMYTNSALHSKLSLLAGGGGLLIGEKEESLERKSW
jgi:hypothetical protein